MGSRGRVITGSLAVLLAMLGGCGSDSEPRVKAGEGYSAVVSWAVRQQYPNRTEDDPTPLVFITTTDGSTISATTQAKVIRDAGDQVKINFVDKREDAIDANDPVEAVKDDGLLLAVGPIPSSARSSVQIDASLYANYVDKSTWRLLLVADDSGVRVTQEEEQPPPPK